MFLKINFDLDVKKLKFDEKLRNIENLQQFVEDFTKMPRDNLDLSFINAENLDSRISTQEDLDRFINSNAGQRFAVIDVKPREDKNQLSDFINVTELRDAEVNNLVLEAKHQPVDQNNSEGLNEILTVDRSKDKIETLLSKNRPPTENTNVSFSSRDIIDHCKQFLKNKIQQSDLSIDCLDELTLEEDQPADQHLKPCIKKRDLKIAPQEELIMEENVSEDKLLRSVAHFRSQICLAINEFKKESPVAISDEFATRFDARLYTMEQQIQLLTEKLSKELDKKKAQEVKEKLAEIREHPLPVNTVHESTKCSACNIGPIIGKRFACLVCPKYDLCEACEAANQHIHPMTRCLYPMSDYLVKLNRRYYERALTKAEKIKEEPNMKVAMKFTNARDRPSEATSEKVVAMECRMKLDQVQQKLLQVPTSQEQKVDQNEIEDLIMKTTVIQFMVPSIDDARVHSILHEFGHLPLEPFMNAVNAKYSEAK